MHVLLFTSETRAAVVKSQDAKSRLPESLILKELEFSLSNNNSVNFSCFTLFMFFDSVTGENVPLLYSTQFLPQEKKKKNTCKV